MPTLRIEMGVPNRFGERKVYIRMHHNGDNKRIPMPFRVTASQTNKGVISDNMVQLAVNKAMLELQTKIIQMGFEVNSLSCDSLAEILMREYAGKSTKKAGSGGDNADDFKLDFLKWIEECYKSHSDSSRGTARTVVKRLKEYCEAEFCKSTIDINELTKNFVGGFVESLLSDGKLSKLSVNKYMAIITYSFNEACKKYNNPDEGEILVKRSPFGGKDAWAIKQADINKRQDNRLPPDTIKKILQFKVQGNDKAEIGRTAFLLSFGLCGMNLIDMMKLTNLGRNGHVEFERSKTSQRSGFSFVSVEIQPHIKEIHEKLLSENGSHVWKFFDMCHGCAPVLANSVGSYFKRFIKLFVSEYAKSWSCSEDEAKQRLEISDNLTFYSARHSWATIAANECHIPIEIIDKGLCHAPKTIAERAYIKRDFGDLNNANRQIMDYVFGAC